MKIDLIHCSLRILVGSGQQLTPERFFCQVAGFHEITIMLKSIKCRYFLPEADHDFQDGPHTTVRDFICITEVEISDVEIFIKGSKNWYVNATRLQKCFYKEASTRLHVKKFK